jgi:hypothetical protein
MAVLLLELVPALAVAVLLLVLLVLLVPALAVLLLVLLVGASGAGRALGFAAEPASNEGALPQGLRPVGWPKGPAEVEAADEAAAAAGLERAADLPVAA